MERTTINFGLGERLAALGIIIGVFGVVAGVTFPIAFPEVDPAIARYFFIASAVIIAVSVVYFITDIAVYFLSKQGVKLGSALVIIGIALIVVGSAAGLLGAFMLDSPSRHEGKQPQSKLPDITLRFIYPDMPSVVLVNQSDKLARDIKWSVVLWNIDDPRTYINPGATPDAHDPLPMPVATFDFLRPHATGGAQTIFNTALVLPHVKPRQRLIGSASVICPECKRGHTYIVYIVYGSGGWYTEVLDKTNGELIVPHHFKKELVQQYFKEIMETIPENARQPIE